MSGLPWELRRRGLKDAAQHDKRVREAIRKNLRELIAEEAIITSDGNKRIRIPLRYLEQYRFKYGNPQQGVGQGPGQPGDVIARRVGDGTSPGDGTPGDQPGEHTYEVEVSLEELTQMMLADLSLPWLEEKARREIRTKTLEWTNERRTGSPGNLKKRKSLLKNIVRNAARGNPAKVANLDEADLRFRAWDEKEEVHANAAVYMLMDCSGSMTTGKKYIAKSFFFWMVRFLRLKYRTVETVFIAHDVDAQVVPEEDFFALSNSGGTRCSSAYQVALEHLLKKHPSAGWNNYLFHFSDGDNLPSDNLTCKTLIETLLGHCNMVGYGEIRYGDDSSFYGWIGQTSYTPPSSLQGILKEIKHPRLVVATITNKDELHPTLIKFLEADKVVKA
ncbi:MAG: hypothetical protein G01um101448_882 [Parcubacteria group bacterium Gr01-1014_48]|nr:MAG: hypothetical protein Greene041614_1050 [Parcubacteria group bacterium Greene0416_14]TSC72948.1 MAG: hypothetical protein G01um101448_882 [Parcubacteria group bacterium Gr01-1014_48]TSC99747.1 MAG: hypothetical protein Greene101415_1108 [Parcubacteria group bacterium Greene1014_15]TSD07698.1 MAG: hypothetical protein Greene07144_814 [Parcubacteria group bacterium Greene0714_4]